MTQLERMIDRAKKVKTDLDQEREKEKREKERLERERVNDEAPLYKRQDAFCEVCDRDYSVMLKKHGTSLLAYYVAFCPYGHPVRREITLRDRYYDQSKKVRAEREMYSDLLLTPNDPRFRLVYPEQWKELERQREEREKINVQKG